MQQEEVATFYAVMLETDYISKPVFRKNFWEDFKQVLGKKHEIKDLDNCDFTPIFNHFQAEKEKKKQMTREEKLAIKEQKDKMEEKYKFALVDGKKEQVGNRRPKSPINNGYEYAPFFIYIYLKIKRKSAVLAIFLSGGKFPCRTPRTV